MPPALAAPVFVSEDVPVPKWKLPNGVGAAITPAFAVPPDEAACVNRL